MPASTSTVDFRPSAESAPSDGCTLRKCTTKPSCSKPPRPPLPPPPRRTMSQVSRASVSRGGVPFASSSSYTPSSRAHASAGAPSTIRSSTTSPPFGNDNALQLDFGPDHQTSPASVRVLVLEHQEEENGSPRNLHYTYVDAWAEVQCQTWGSRGWDVEWTGGRPSGRKNAASRDPRLASRPTSRSSSMRRIGA